jgi:hypothetical protein
VVGYDDHLTVKMLSSSQQSVNSDDAEISNSNDTEHSKWTELGTE